MPHGRFNGYKEAIKAAIETRKTNVTIQEPFSLPIPLNPALIEEMIDAQTQKNISRLTEYIKTLSVTSIPVHDATLRSSDPKIHKKSKNIKKTIATKKALIQEYEAAGETLKRALNILTVGTEPQIQATKMVKLLNKFASKKPQTSAMVVLSQDILENLNKTPKISRPRKKAAKEPFQEPTTPFSLAFSMIDQEIQSSQKTILQSPVGTIPGKIESDLADRHAKLQAIYRPRPIPIEKEISMINKYFKNPPGSAYANHPVSKRILAAVAKFELEYEAVPPPPPLPIDPMRRRKPLPPIPPPKRSPKSKPRKRSF